MSSFVRACVFSGVIALSSQSFAQSSKIGSFNNATQEYIRNTLSEDKLTRFEKLNSAMQKVMQKIENGKMRMVVQPTNIREDWVLYDVYVLKINDIYVEFLYSNIDGQTRFSMGSTSPLMLQDIDCLNNALDANVSVMHCNLLP